MIIEMNEGPKIRYQEQGSRIFFGFESTDELMVNVAKYQRDWPVHLDICSNRDRQLVVGAGKGLYYVAQIDIPATEYEPQPESARITTGSEDSGMMEAQDPPKALPLDMEKVVLTLWSTDNPTSIE